jgi:hypothetical protein
LVADYAGAGAGLDSVEGRLMDPTINTIADGIAWIDEARSIRDDAEAEMKRIEQLIVQMFSPVQVGDIAEVNGLSSTGRKMRVFKVVMGYYGEDFVYFSAQGHLINRDGTQGMMRGIHRTNYIPVKLPRMGTKPKDETSDE